MRAIDEIRERANTCGSVEVVDDINNLCDALEWLLKREYKIMRSLHGKKKGNMFNRKVGKKIASILEGKNGKA